MSQTLATLIKVHQHQVDEQRRALAQLEEARARALQAIEEDKVHMAQQRDAAREDLELSRQLPGYLKAMLDRKDQWLRQITDLEQMISMARDELQNRFAELKKFELAQQAELDAARAERLRQENLTLDEVAGQRDRARAERNKS